MLKSVCDAIVVTVLALCVLSKSGFWLTSGKRLEVFGSQVAGGALWDATRWEQDSNLVLILERESW
jgi:hypothetical protein